MSDRASRTARGLTASGSPLNWQFRLNQQTGERPGLFVVESEPFGPTPDGPRLTRTKCGSTLKDPASAEHSGVVVNDRGLAGCDGQLRLIESYLKPLRIVRAQDHPTRLG